MKIELVFDSWEDGTLFEYEMGIFHAGTTFKGSIELRKDEEAEFLEALEKGFKPKFVVWRK